MKEEYHAIYQELIAVLKAISGLWTNNPDVEKILKEYKHYNPAYQIIFQFAAKVSLSNSKLFQRFTISQEMIARFWGALYGDASDSSDLLGVAEGALIQLCLNVLTDDDLKALVSSSN